MVGRNLGPSPEDRLVLVVLQGHVLGMVIRARKNIVLQALRRWHESLAEGSNIMLRLEIAVENGALRLSGDVEVNAMTDSIVALLGDVVSVVDSNLGEGDGGELRPYVSTGNGLVIQSCGIVLAQVLGCPAMHNMGLRSRQIVIGTSGWLDSRRLPPARWADVPLLRIRFGFRGLVFAAVNTIACDVVRPSACEVEAAVDLILDAGGRAVVAAGKRIRMVKGKPIKR